MAGSNSDFNIEQLSRAIATHAEAASADALAEMAREHSPEALPLCVDELPLTAVDKSMDLEDLISHSQHTCFVDAEGRFLLYRVAVLGIASAVEQTYQELQHKLAKARDPLLGDLTLEIRYNVGLFGGEVGDAKVSTTDTARLTAHLATYRPNLLVVVDATEEKERFSAGTPQQLAMLTRALNHGALFAGQRPYALVLVTEARLEEQSFETYARACHALRTPPALLQHLPTELDRVVSYARFEAIRFAADHLRQKKRLPREATHDLDLGLENEGD
ncbi:MAG: hypothetical protein JRH20_13885 [Deltaproteobacteria bacterium]|nr:hypothetical protein [Deltaproteobacteria bacterium]